MAQRMPGSEQRKQCCSGSRSRSNSQPRQKDSGPEVTAPHAAQAGGKKISMKPAKAREVQPIPGRRSTCSESSNQWDVSFVVRLSAVNREGTVELLNEQIMRLALSLSDENGKVSRAELFSALI